MREYHRRQEPVACECGFKLKCGTGLVQHKRSVVHRRATRLHALLDSCLNFSTIGERLGISRERVRQLASSLGYKPGRERRSLCRLKKSEKEVTESPMITALRQSCPYPVELIRLPSTNTEIRFYKSEVMILGKRCAVCKGGFKTKTTIYFNYSRGYVGHCEFTLVFIPDGRWVVCRNSRSPSLLWSGLGERVMPVRAAAMGGWNERVGAWHILES